MKKIVINACYGGFGLSNEAMDRMIELGYELERNPGYVPNSFGSLFNPKYFEPYDIDRTDPILVQVVEELGKKASGDCANLVIEEVSGQYRITEYDGFEGIETPNGIPWQTA